MALTLDEKVVGHQGARVSHRVGTEGVAGQAQVSRSFSHGVLHFDTCAWLQQDKPADGTGYPCNVCYRVVSPPVELTRLFEGDRAYSATVSPGHQPSEPIPFVGLVGLHFLIEPLIWIYRGVPGVVSYLSGGDTRAGTPAPLTSPLAAVAPACATWGCHPCWWRQLEPPRTVIRSGNEVLGAAGGGWRSDPRLGSASPRGKPS